MENVEVSFLSHGIAPRSCTDSFHSFLYMVCDLEKPLYSMKDYIIDLKKKQKISPFNIFS